MKQKQQSSPICDYFTTVKVGRESFRLPTGRLWRYTVSRVNYKIEIIVYYRGEQYSYHSVTLKTGI